MYHVETLDTNYYKYPRHRAYSEPTPKYNLNPPYCLDEERHQSIDLRQSYETNILKYFDTVPP